MLSMMVCRMEYSDLLKAYRQFVAEPTKSALPEDSTEQNVVVYESAWVQIFLIRNLKPLGLVELVVEVSLPNCVYDINARLNAGEVTEENAPQLQNILWQMGVHINYLLRLSEVGFRLAVVAEEGIWSASIKLEQPPSKELTLVLKPPPAAIQLE